jgi:uroporphyrinogen decarboxylase
MRFQEVDRAPNWEMGYWAGTLDRWYQEGLPRHSDAPKGLVSGAGVKGEGFPWRRREPKDSSVNTHFALDKGIEKIDGEWGIWPPFDPQVFREDEENIQRREPDGTVVLVRKDSATLPHPLEWPVKGRQTWEQLKAERLRIDLTGRLPAAWSEHLAAYKTRDWPLVIGGSPFGVFSSLRSLIGFENLMYLFFDDPQLIHDVLNHLSALWLGLFEEVLALTDVDFAYIWEDMTFKGGAMVSPRIFCEFLMPVYKRITGFFRARGLDIVLVDTDGNVWGLIPLLLEGGVTGLYPFEVRAGMDVAEVRARYPRLQMLGGIDKTALTEGPAAIDKELARIAPVIKTGGYVPGVDHYVPPDVPWAHFEYYRRKLRESLWRS